MSAFLDFILNIVEIPDNQQTNFKNLVFNHTVKKNEYFLQAGDLADSVAYVKNGLFRYFYINENGDEYTKGFFVANTVIISYSAILEKRPSYFSIQALEDSELEVVNYYKFEKYFEEDPCWNKFLIPLLQKAYLIKEERERDFLLLDAEQRYEKFQKKFPGLESRIKQSIVASYLGITPESLSRIRKKRIS